MPLIEQVAPEQGSALRDAVSQLQLAYVRIGGKAASAGGPATPTSGPGAPHVGSPGGPPEPEPEASKPGEPGPAQRSGRLWLPGQ